MKTLNWISFILSLPFRIGWFLGGGIVGFFMTDWEDKESRAYYKKETIGLFKIHN